jgi:hypothetical protein
MILSVKLTLNLHSVIPVFYPFDVAADLTAIYRGAEDYEEGEDSKKYHGFRDAFQKTTESKNKMVDK